MACDRIGQDPAAGLGVQSIGAPLRLWAPDAVPTGTYRSTR